MAYHSDPQGYYAHEHEGYSDQDYPGRQHYYGLEDFNDYATSDVEGRDASFADSYG
jgi:hypothetical protein